MTTLSLNPQIASHLDSIEGQTPDDKLLALLETYLASQIRACEQEISEYEVKYRSTFDEFAKARQQGQIANRYGHEVERDYMEWEGLVAEKRHWLECLDDLPKSVPEPLSPEALSDLMREAFSKSGYTTREQVMALIRDAQSESWGIVHLQALLFC
jgi:hypothetical protein